LQMMKSSHQGKCRIFDILVFGNWYSHFL
jgi:hypothetical protein